MPQSIRISPPNSLLLICDPAGGKVPDFVPEELVLATSSCISVGCLTFADGATEITLGPAGEVNAGASPAFDGELETPNQAVMVSTVEWESLLEERVPSAITRIRIWINHPIEPDKVTIGWG
jgi:hypothetical protein